jgi:predicted nucleotidyltransferase
MKQSLDNLIEITKEILHTRYSSSEFAFLSGSIIRGEGTPFSDLDIVVIFVDLPNAFRESFYVRDFPVETFVHTPETLNYFFEQDAKQGIPSLPQMIVEGVAVPNETELSNKLKTLANKVLQNPPKLPTEKLDMIRYGITNLIDDLREPRSKEELTATATELYNVLADFYFRANGLWSAQNKAIPRLLQKNDSKLCRKYCESFEELFISGKQQKVIKLTEKILEPHGGFLFEGVKLDAPEDWRKAFN